MGQYFDANNVFNLPKDQFGVGMGTGYLGGLQHQYSAAMMERQAEDSDLQHQIEQLKYSEAQKDVPVSAAQRAQKVSQADMAVALAPQQKAALGAGYDAETQQAPIKTREAQRVDQAQEVIKMANDVKSQPQTYNPLNKDGLQQINQRAQAVGLPPVFTTGSPDEFNQLQTHAQAVMDTQAHMAAAPKLLEGAQHNAGTLAVAKETGQHADYRSDQYASSRVMAAEARASIRAASEQKFTTWRQQIATMASNHPGEPIPPAVLEMAATDIVQTELKDGETRDLIERQAKRKANDTKGDPLQAQRDAFSSYVDARKEQIKASLDPTYQGGGQGTTQGGPPAAASNGMGTGFAQKAAGMSREQIISQAKDAIASGKNKDMVLQRLESVGIKDHGIQ